MAKCANVDITTENIYDNSDDDDDEPDKRPVNYLPSNGNHTFQYEGKRLLVTLATDTYIEYQERVTTDKIFLTLFTTDR